MILPNVWHVVLASIVRLKLCLLLSAVQLEHTMTLMLKLLCAQFVLKAIPALVLMFILFYVQKVLIVILVKIQLHALIVQLEVIVLYQVQLKTKWMLKNVQLELFV